MAADLPQDNRLQADDAGNANRRLWAGVGLLLIAERDRWPLWFPVGMGVGIGIYFLLPTEPPTWIGPLLLASSLGVFLSGRRRAAIAILGLSFAAPALGFAAAQIRTLMVEAPILNEKVGPRWITGRVVSVEELGNGRRLILSPVSLPNVTEEQTPDRVRIRTPQGAWTPWPGDWIEARAVLNPPPPPVAPGAFDFQRYAYYNDIGAFGFSMGGVRQASSAESDHPDAVRIFLSHLRQRIQQHILAALPGREGTVAAALITGERGSIPQHVLNAMRDSGLAHLLAISGLHIGLVAGFIFFFVRAVLASIPALALRYPIKKWAAIVALLGAFAYLLISGATIPTQRAFLMIALVLLAIMTDRTGVSMRLVAWAAAVVLLLAPESLLGASFQLSFAAVIALVAVYEGLRDRFAPFGRHWSWWQRPLLYFAGVGLTTIVATTATTPYALYHFSRLTAYGLLANLIAVPITAFWIMPFGLLALCLMPFGLEHLPLVAMGWGIAAVLSVAETVSAWPGAIHTLPTPPTWPILLITLGGLWACLWRRRWRYWGLVPVAVGAFGLAQGQPPNLMITHDARLAAVDDGEGRWLFSSARREAFVRDSWLRRVGATEWAAWPDDGPSPGGALRCDSLGCIYHVDGWVVAIVQQPDAAAEDCAVADAVVSFVPLGHDCRPTTGIVIDRFDLWRDGAHALWIEPEGLRTLSTRETRGDRAWVGLP